MISTKPEQASSVLEADPRRLFIGEAGRRERCQRSGILHPKGEIRTDQQPGIAEHLGEMAQGARIEDEGIVVNPARQLQRRGFGKVA